MKLLLIDGYSLLYRAFFSSPPLTTSEGVPTGALFGFVKMALSLIDDMTPDAVLVAMDAHAPTFRHDSFAAYKANRAETPFDLKAQTARVRELLDGLSIPHYEHIGYEADDILGTLSAMASREKHEVIIVTGDGDALQLADENVSVLLTRRGVSELDCYTPADVKNRFQFGPELLPDYKGLRGDSSDNIPGVPGIGEKTGISLISKFGALENLYQHLDEVTPPRIRSLLETHRDVAFESRTLARIIRDLPIEIDLEHCNYCLDAAKRATARQTVHEYEFKSLYRRYEEKDAAASEATAVEAAKVLASPLSEPAPELMISRAANEAEFRQWHSENAGTLALWHDENGTAISSGQNVVLLDGALEAVKNWLEDETQPKIVHDAKTLMLELARRQISLRGAGADTLLMAYLLDPNRQQHPPALLAEKYLKRTLPEVDAELLKASRKQPAKKAKAAKSESGALFEEAPPESEAVDEAEAERAQRLREQRDKLLAETAAALFAVEPALRAELEQIGAIEILETMEMPLVEVLVAMEQSGMLLDEVRLRETGALLEAEAQRLQGEIWELAGEEFNVGSTKQLQTILYEKLGLSPGRSIKTGYSTDVHTLEKLAEKHDIVQKILDYRGTTKLKSTYVDALLSGMDAKTHRIHSSLNQTGTVSGRLSSTNPNLQNVPIRTPQGRLIRKAFIAPPGHVLLAVDYSQIELRILAHITGDDTLVEAFRLREDVHARTAADLFDVPVAEVNSEMRRKAKMTNYAIAYGVSGFGLAKQLGSGTAGEATEFIKRYFEALPGVKNYIDDTLQSARVDGFVQTLLGRRRPLPEIGSPRAQERAAAERTAINHPIQGTAADMMKLAMLAIHEAMSEHKLQARMTMQVHDELVFEVPEAEVEIMAELVTRLMCEVPAEKLKLRVPLEADAEIGLNWDDTESWSSAP